MKSKTSILLVFAVFLSACNAPVNTAPTSSSNAFAPGESNTPLPAKLDAPKVESPAIINIDMLDDSNGWAVTETQIVRTDDGGVSWHNVSPQGPAEFGYSASTFFLDVNTAWVLFASQNNYPNEGTLYHTTDGGNTWKTIAAPFSSGKYVFLDADNGWMMADFGAGTGNMAIAIFQTNNGGETWTRTYINDPTITGAGDSLPLSGLKNSIAPVDSKRAFVGGLTYAPGEPYLYETKDSGKTWERVSVQAPENSSNAQLTVDEVQFVSPNDGYFVMRLYMDTARTAVYVTHDGGDTWALTPTLITDAGSQVFISPTDAVLYTSSGFYATQDAGNTWQTIAPNMSFGDNFATLDFADLNTGWVITIDANSKHDLYKTTDGGKTWAQVAP